MAYKEEARLKIKGLYTSPNQFSEIPEGALLVANNVNLDRDSVLTTRRGFTQYGNPVDTTGNIYSLFSYQNKLISWTTENKLLYDTDGDGLTWTAYTGTFLVPDPTVVGSRVRSFQSNKNFYFTTSEGVFKLDSITATPTQSGAPQGLSGTGALTGSSGFMANDTAVAYRIVWGYKDANNNLILGAASDRIIVINSSGGTRDVNLTFAVPVWPSLDTNWFYQVYRSNPSATAADTPDDDYQQVIEDNPTSGELSSRSITVTDITPDDLRQAFLYSSASQEGAASANFAPPFCKDMCSFRNYAFYANTKEVQSYTLTLLAVDSPDGIQINDTITFDFGTPTLTLTGKAVENAAAGQFLVYTSGTPSQNIETTCRSIVNVLNSYASNTRINAFYASGFDDLPGKMIFQRRTFFTDTVTETDSFFVYSNRTTCWTPQIPSTAIITSSNQSNNHLYPNRIYISKLQQPEAVPLLQYFDIGSASEPILRIIPLRDAVMIFKPDGIFTIFGNDITSFNQSTIDNTAIVVAPNSVVAFNNAVYFYSQQGVCRITPDGSPEVISIPIEKDLLVISSANYPNFPELTNAVGYESERKYIMATITTPTDTVATQEYVFNSLTSSWTKWDREYYCAIINPADNKMYYGGQSTSDGPYVYQERKEYANSDYADEQYDVNIVSYSGLDIVLTDLTNVEVDMTIQQDNIAAIIESIDEDTNTITVSDLNVWTVGTATIFTPIEVNARTTQISGSNPGIMKQMAEISLIFETPNFDDITVTFFSDYIAAGYEVVLHPVNQGAWGQFPWGTVPWGGDLLSYQRLRTFVPKPVQRCNWMVMNIATKQCFVNFALEGFTVMMNQVGPRQKN